MDCVIFSLFVFQDAPAPDSFLIETVTLTFCFRSLHSCLSLISIKVCLAEKRMKSQSTTLRTRDLTDGEIRDLQNTYTRRTPQPRASGRGRPVSDSLVIRNDGDDDEIRHTGAQRGAFSSSAASILGGSDRRDGVAGSVPRRCVWECHDDPSVHRFVAQPSDRRMVPATQQFLSGRHVSDPEVHSVVHPESGCRLGSSAGARSAYIDDFGTANSRSSLKNSNCLLFSTCYRHIVDLTCYVNNLTALWKFN